MSADGFIFDGPAAQTSDEDNGVFWDTREIVVYLIDCTTKMLAIPEEGESYYKLCLLCCKNAFRKKIVGSSSDILGVVLYGTKDKNLGDETPKNVLTLYEPKRPGADIIIKMNDLLSMEDFPYGSSCDFSLPDAIWFCSSLISRIKSNIRFKKIVLMTAEDNPHADSPAMQHQARKKAADLRSLGLSVELVHLGEDFNGAFFYREFLKIANNEDVYIEPSCKKLGDLEKYVNRKDYKKRSVGSVNFYLNEHVFIAISIYNFYRQYRIPSILHVDRRTNEECQMSRKVFNPDTGQKYLKTDLIKTTEVCGETVRLSYDDIRKFQISHQPQLVLLGFTSVDKLTPEYHLNKADFIYPNEDKVKGSKALFAALLKKCAAKEKMAVCAFIKRMKARPRLVYLIPQEEEMDPYVPSGFHVIYLPFADNIREVEMEQVQEEEEEEEKEKERKETMEKIVKKLRFRYKTDFFENPKVQSHWAAVEAIALNLEQPQQIEDKTTVDMDRVSIRLGDLEGKFEKLFIPQGYVLPEGAVKRSAPEGPNCRMTKAKAIKLQGPADVEKQVRSGNAKGLTVMQIKDYLAEKNVPLNSSMKKHDYVTLIEKFILG